MTWSPPPHWQLMKRAMPQNKPNEMRRFSAGLAQTALLLAGLGMLTACQTVSQPIPDITASSQNIQSGAEQPITDQTEQLTPATQEAAPSEPLEADETISLAVATDAGYTSSLDLKEDELVIAQAPQAEGLLAVIPAPKKDPEPEAKPAPKANSEPEPAPKATAIQTLKPTPKPAPKPAPIPHIIPASLVGQNGVELLSHLGAPDFTRYEMQVHIWQYRLPSCVVDFFFYPIDTDKAVMVRNTPSSLKDSVKGLIITNSHARTRIFGTRFDSTACHRELAQRQ